MRADRLEDRTAENVATANTSVPAAVAKEEIVTQSSVRTIGRQSATALPPMCPMPTKEKLTTRDYRIPSWSDRPVDRVIQVHSGPQGFVSSTGPERAGQSELLAFGTDAEVHARPMHISSEEPSPHVTKWDGALRRMGSS